MKALQNPNEKMQFICIPIKIKLKFYPFIIISIFLITMGIKIDLFAAIIVSIIDYKFLRDKLSFLNEKIAILEAHEFLNLLKNSQSSFKYYN